MTIIKPIPPPLPSTRDELMMMRVVKAARTLNDVVEDVYKLLWESEEFRRYLEAVYPEQALEGSLEADDFEAATLIRAKAEEAGFKELVKEKKATIVKAMRVVQRRYKQSREQRRDMVGGEIVPDDDESENQ